MKSKSRRRRDGDEPARAGHRHARLSHLIAETLDAVVRELVDPALEGVTLDGVDLSVDGHHAFVRYLASETPRAQAGLVRASSRLRQAVADRLGIRRVPELHFVPDPRGGACDE